MLLNFSGAGYTSNNPFPNETSPGISPSNSVRALEFNHLQPKLTSSPLGRLIIQHKSSLANMLRHPFHTREKPSTSNLNQSHEVALTPTRPIRPEASSRRCSGQIPVLPFKPRSENTSIAGTDTEPDDLPSTTCGLASSQQYPSVRERELDWRSVKHADHLDHKLRPYTDFGADDPNLRRSGLMSLRNFRCSSVYSDLSVEDHPVYDLCHTSPALNGPTKSMITISDTNLYPSNVFYSTSSQAQITTAHFNQSTGDISSNTDSTHSSNEDNATDMDRRRLTVLLKISPSIQATLSQLKSLGHSKRFSRPTLVPGPLCVPHAHQAQVEGAPSDHAVSDNMYELSAIGYISRTTICDIPGEPASQTCLRPPCLQIPHGQNPVFTLDSRTSSPGYQNNRQCDTAICEQEGYTSNLQNGIVHNTVASPRPGVQALNVTSTSIPSGSSGSSTPRRRGESSPEPPKPRYIPPRSKSMRRGDLEGAQTRHIRYHNLDPDVSTSHDNGGVSSKDMSWLSKKFERSRGRRIIRNRHRERDTTGSLEKGGLIAQRPGVNLAPAISPNVSQSTKPISIPKNTLFPSKISSDTCQNSQLSPCTASLPVLSYSANAINSVEEIVPAPLPKPHHVGVTEKSLPPSPTLSRSSSRQFSNNHVANSRTYTYTYVDGLIPVLSRHASESSLSQWRKETQCGINELAMLYAAGKLKDDVACVRDRAGTSWF